MVVEGLEGSIRAGTIVPFRPRREEGSAHYSSAGLGEDLATVSTPSAAEAPAQPEEADQQYSPAVRREYELLRQLVGTDHSFSLAEYAEWREECLEEDGAFHVNSRQFRHGLSVVLGFRDRDVHGGPLDAIFGNQDGRLNGQDVLSVDQFGGCLDLARSFFGV